MLMIEHIKSLNHLIYPDCPCTRGESNRLYCHPIIPIKAADTTKLIPEGGPPDLMPRAGGNWKEEMSQYELKTKII